MKALLLVALVACGGPRKLVAEEAARLNPPEGVGLARTQVAVARGQVAANQLAAAKATLAGALERLREQSSHLDISMLEAVDVLVAMNGEDDAGAAQLRDEAVAKLREEKLVRVVVDDAFAPEIDLESKLAVDALVEIALSTTPSFDKLEVGSRVWQAAVDRATGKGWFYMLVLARQARLVGKLDAARPLVERAAASPLEDADQRLSVAEEAVLCGSTNTAKQLVAKLDGFDEPAVAFARLARVHALLGDSTASDAAMKQALAATPTNESWRAERWRYLALSRTTRGDPEAVLSIETEHMTEQARFLVYELIEQGQTDVATELLDRLSKDTDKASVKYALVDGLVKRGELGKARALADDKSLSLVAQAYANTGELIEGSSDTLVPLAARRLAQRGKCDAAIKLVKREKYPGEALAGIARYCAKSAF